MTTVHNTFVFSSSQVKERALLGLRHLFLDAGYPERLVSVSFIARYYGVRVSVVQRAFEGFGSRRVRVGIAHLIELKPSDIWFNRSERDMLIDDYDYFYDDKPEFIKLNK